MEISFIIPAKNESNFLPRCLESVRNAIIVSSKSAEILLIDNDSTDNTVNIAQNYGCHVHIVKNKTIAGLRNFGAKIASGRYLAFIDADCVIDSNWIMLCRENLKINGIAATGTRAIPSKEYGNWVSWAWFYLAAGSKRPDNVLWIGTSNLLISKQTFWEFDGFAENLQTAEDVDFCTRLNSTYKIRLEKRIDTIHLREPSSLASLFKKEIWRGKSSLACFSKNGYKLNEFYSILPPFAVGLALLLIPVDIFLKNLLFSYVFFFQILFFPVALMVKKGVPVLSFKSVASIYVVSLIFIFARSVSMLRESAYIASSWMLKKWRLRIKG